MLRKIVKKAILSQVLLGIILSSVGLASDGLKIKLAPLASVKTEKMIADIFAGQSNVDGQVVFDQIYSYWQQDFNDSKDYLNKKGRYQKALKDLYMQISEVEMQERLHQGDLKTITQYTDEKKDKKGLPLSEDKQTYSIINRALWAEAKLGQALPVSVKKFVNHLDLALSQLPTFSGIVFRGTSLSQDEADLILTKKKNEKLMAAYTSTSLDIGDAFDFIHRQKNNKDKIKTLMIIEGEGKLISLGGDFVREEEILIQRNTRFNIQQAFKVKVGNEDEGYVDWIILFCKF